MGKAIIITPDPREGPATHPVWVFPQGSRDRPNPYGQLMHLVAARKDAYPLLYSMTRAVEGPEADFLIPRERIPNFTGELSSILAEVEKLDGPTATVENPGTYTELRQALRWLRAIAMNCEKWRFAIMGHGD